MEELENSVETTQNESMEDVISDGTETKQNKTFTEDEVNDIVKKRVAREQKKIAKMLDTDKFENELLEREQKIIERELRADARQQLTEVGLPLEIADIIKWEDPESYEETFNKVYELFSTKYDEAVDQGIKAALRGETPRVGKKPGFSETDRLKNAFMPKKGY